MHASMLVYQVDYFAIYCCFFVQNIWKTSLSILQVILQLPHSIIKRPAVISQPSSEGKKMRTTAAEDVVDEAIVAEDEVDERLTKDLEVDDERFFVKI
jgi:hypothetical protein